LDPLKVLGTVLLLATGKAALTAQQKGLEMGPQKAKQKVPVWANPLVTLLGVGKGLLTEME
jgi:hypothetical protein